MALPGAELRGLGLPAVGTGVGVATLRLPGPAVPALVVGVAMLGLPGPGVQALVVGVAVAMVVVAVAGLQRLGLPSLRLGRGGRSAGGAELVARSDRCTAI